MSYHLKSSEKTILLPVETLRHFSAAGESEIKALVLLYAILGEKEEFEESEALSYLSENGISEAEALSALAFWRGAKILERGRKKASAASAKGKASIAFDPEKKPSYTSKELADELDKKGGFCELYDYATRRLEKSLNTSETATLFSFTDYLCLPVDLIMLVTEYCVGQGKKSIRYIEKMLITLADNGVVTYEAGEKYIENQKKLSSFEGKIRTLLGLGERSFTPKEKTLISSIRDRWEENFPMVETAYEKTISAIAKPSLSYMAKILESWDKNGINSPDELVGKAAPDAGKKSYDLDDFFAAALNKKKKQEN